MTESPVGKTKDAGWEIGVSRTLPVPINEVWRVVTSPDGVACWLGAGVELPAEKGERYETDDGTIGEIRSFRPLDRLRLTWQPPDWITSPPCRSPCRTRATRRSCASTRSAWPAPTSASASAPTGKGHAAPPPPPRRHPDDG